MAAKRLLVFVMAGGLCLTTTLVAGTKNNSEIKVCNNFAFNGVGEPIGVIVDPSEDLIDLFLAGNATLDDFEREGGLIVAPGACGKFSVRAGEHCVFAIDFDNIFVLNGESPFCVDLDENTNICLEVDLNGNIFNINL